MSVDERDRTTGDDAARPEPKATRDQEVALIRERLFRHIGGESA